LDFDDELDLLDFDDEDAKTAGQVRAALEEREPDRRLRPADRWPRTAARIDSRHRQHHQVWPRSTAPSRHGSEIQHRAGAGLRRVEAAGLWIEEENRPRESQGPTPSRCAIDASPSADVAVAGLGRCCLTGYRSMLRLRRLMNRSAGWIRQGHTG